MPKYSFKYLKRTTSVDNLGLTLPEVTYTDIPPHIKRKKKQRSHSADSINSSECCDISDILSKTSDTIDPNMATCTKNDLVEVLGKQKSRKTFVPKDFSGKTTDNARDFLSSFKNYCALNNIVGDEQLLTFEMCLSGTAKCWFIGLHDDTKKDITLVYSEFENNYLKSNQWLNTTRLESRKLLRGESAENYINDMSNLALLVGIHDQELSKALIRGLPDKLRWHVMTFNPTTLGETIQRILLGEAALSLEVEKEQIHAVYDNSSLHEAINKVDARLANLECTVKSTAEKPAVTLRQQPGAPTTCDYCGVMGHHSDVCWKRIGLPRGFGRGNTSFGQNYNRNFTPSSRGYQQNYNRGYNSRYNNRYMSNNNGYGNDHYMYNNDRRGNQYRSPADSRGYYNNNRGYNGRNNTLLPKNGPPRHM